MRPPSFLGGLAGGGDRLALRCGDVERSFSALDRRSNQLARALQRRGLAAGDRLAIICRNCAAFVETVLACERAGLRATAIIYTVRSNDLAAALRRCEPRAVVTNVREIVDVLGATGAILPLAVKLFVGGAFGGFEDYESALSRESAEPTIAEAAGIFMPLSSGTTSAPKVIYRQTAYTPPYLRELLSALAFAPGRDLAFVPTPLLSTGVYSLGASLALKSGVGVIVAEATTYDSVDPEEVLRVIARERVTHLYLPIFLLRRLMALPERVRRAADLCSLRSVLHGASPCPPALKEAAIDWLGPILTEYYAGAEGGGTVITSAEWLRHPGSVGKPTPGLLRIVAADGSDAAPGETGQIYFRVGKAQRFAYFRDPEATARAYRGDYFTLGDLGRLDDEGYLHLAGRTEEVINFVGYSVSPAEIDEVLLAHPAVRQCATVGIPHALYGEMIGAVVALERGRDGSPALTAELLQWCDDRLTRFKRPQAIVYAAEIPGFARGKVNRSALRELFAAAAAPEMAG